MADKLKLATNVPQEIALKFSEGRPFSSEYGDSVMFTLTDDRIWFAPPIVAQKISQLGVARGELFRVVKAEVVKGNRRTVEYQVSRIQAELPAPPTVTAVGQQGRQVVPVAVQTTTPVSRGREAAVEQLRRAFEVSIDGLLAARDYAQASGLELQFSESNIISVAMSVYISAQKEGARWAA